MNWAQLLCDEKIVKISRTVKSKNDSRSMFEKDYHRIISSAAFRRLQDKAQVFPLEKQDFARTRLTHSIEAASIARSLGRDLVRRKGIENIDPLLKNNPHLESILECAGLIHDIGNPPFGHFGETSICNWFREKDVDNSFMGGRFISFWKRLSKLQQSDFLKFDGNAQGLRTVTRLSNVIDENGLNLTYSLLHTIIKYPWNSDCDKKKTGYFYSEKKLFAKIVKKLGTWRGEGIAFRHPLTLLLEAADDITYLTHDLEDASKKKLFSFESFKKEVLEKAKNSPEAENSPAYAELFAAVARYEEESQRHPEKGLYIIRRFKIYLQGTLIGAALEVFLRHYENIMNGAADDFSLLKASSVKTVVDLIRDFSVKYIYQHKDVLKNEIKGYHVIHKILDRIVPALLELLFTDKPPVYSATVYRLISDSYRVNYENETLAAQMTDEDRIYYALRLAVDFVSGMTDSYAVDFCNFLG